MKISRSFCAAFLLLCCLTAGAHARLQKASPEDGSVITSSPSDIILSFSKPVRLTSLWIRKDNEVTQKLPALLASRAQRIAVAAPRLRPGHYEIRWRAVGDDGHIAFGQIHFTLASAPAPRRGITGVARLSVAARRTGTMVAIVNRANPYTSCVRSAEFPVAAVQFWRAPQIGASSPA